MDFQLDADQVNQFLSTAILNSRIGEVVTAAIDEQIKELSRSYNNPFQAVIRQEIDRLIRDVLQAEHAAYLRAQVQAHLTEAAIDKVLTAAFQNILDRM